MSAHNHAKSVCPGGTHIGNLPNDYNGFAWEKPVTQRQVGPGFLGCSLLGYHKQIVEIEPPTRCPV